MNENILKIKEFIVKNLKWLIVFICIVIFIFIMESVFGKEITNIDTIGYKYVSKYLISDFITPVAKCITNLGGAFFIIPLAIILLITIKNKKIGISISLNLVIVAGINIVLKNILQRPRPNEFRLINESGYSFPSGHSMVSMAFYGYLIYLVYKYIQNKKAKWTIITLLSILILLIGISRIYLGVHYTSDVIAGFLLSISYIIAYTSIIKNII